MVNWGQVPVGSVLPFVFGSYAVADGASITLTGLAVTDIEVYKNASMTQRSSDAGYTLLDSDGIDIDGTTGIHGFSIDTGDDTDVGFYAADAFYTVVVSAVTVDSETVNFVAGTFGLVAVSPSVTEVAQATRAEMDANSTQLAAILADTAEIGVAGAGLTAINLPDQTMNITGDITGNLSGSVGSVTGAVGSVTAAVTAGTVSDKTGYSLSSAGIQAIWDALTSALTTASSIGKLLVDNINATISSRLASASYTTPPTAAAIADQVWEEAIADHSGTAGSTAEQLAAAGSAGDPWATALPGAYTAGQAGKIVGDNLNATVSSRASQTSVDTIDDFLDSEAAAILAAVDTEVAAIKAVTDLLPDAGALTSLATAAALATVDTNVDAILVDTGTTLQAELDGIQADTEDIQSKIGTPAGVSVSADIAAVKAETASILTDTAEIGAAGAGLTALASAANLATVDTVVDAVLALLDDARSEPAQGAPPVNPDMATKVDYLYKALRNKIEQTATELKIYADDGTTVDHKATVSDDGTTYTRGELGTGA